MIERLAQVAVVTILVCLALLVLLIVMSSAVMLLGWC